MPISCIPAQSLFYLKSPLAILPDPISLIFFNQELGIAKFHPLEKMVLPKTKSQRVRPDSLAFQAFNLLYGEKRMLREGCLSEQREARSNKKNGTVNAAFVNHPSLL